MHSDRYSYELYTGDATKVVTAPSATKITQNTKQPLFAAEILRNPVKAEVNLQVKSETDQAINIVIRDESGNLIAQQKFTVNKGINKLSINANDWR